MRIQTEFTVASLMASVEGVGETTVWSVLRRFQASGYVVRTNPGVALRPGVCATYRLARNTGPVAPRSLPGGRSYDVNLKREFGGKSDFNPLHVFGGDGDGI